MLNEKLVLLTLQTSEILRVKCIAKRILINFGKYKQTHNHNTRMASLPKYMDAYGGKHWIISLRGQAHHGGYLQAL